MSERKLHRKARTPSLRGRIPEKPSRSEEKVSWKTSRWWKLRILEFFGIEDDDKSRDVWKARREHYMKNKWLISTKDDVDDDDVDGGKSVEADVIDGPEAVQMEAIAESPLLGPGEKKTGTKTGRKRVIGEAPEHRTRPPMPSVFAMAVSAFRTLIKSKPAKVGHPVPVQNVRSFQDEDSDGASDIDDDGRSFFGPDEDELDGRKKIEPPVARAESTTVTESKPRYRYVEDDGDFPDGGRSVRYEVRKKPGLRKPPIRLKDDRRYAGIGVVGKWFNRSYKWDSEDFTPRMMEKLKDPDMHRPYFTWWLMTVQVIVLIVSMAVYGVAPIGFEFKTKQGQVMSTSLAIESRGYDVEQNFWIGPSYENLIHLGAKFGPCMRRDSRVYDAIEEERRAEIEDYGCCVRLDRIGCVFASSSECRKSLFTEFVKYNVTYAEYDSNTARTSGPLCKSDPKYCSNPVSGNPPWENDVSKWPVCHNLTSYDPSVAPHLECEEVTGRPCCVGVQGECIMATKDECNFYDGFYHEDKRLCSEVSCMEDICGLTDFLHRDKPDQIYRVWISLFLHVGVIHCLISLVVEFVIGRDIEKLAGWFKMMLIFIFSGIGGNIVSAFFTPYQPEVGPSGAIFGLFAALIMDVIQQWNILVKPVMQLLKLLIILLILFVLGLLPYVDNYAHVSGFIFGLLLSAAFLPSIGTRKKTKIIMICVCLPLCIALLVMFFVLFYLVELDCDGCKYFTCIPVTKTFCLDLDQKLRERFSDERLAI